MLKKIVFSLAILLLFFCGGRVIDSLLVFANASQQREEYSSRLFTPTFITKLNDLYFIVDCWHHRILYSEKMGGPIDDWKILDDEITGPHSIATDGSIYVAEDTGRGRIFVYQQQAGEPFKRTQVIENVGIRPHRTIYDNDTRRFYVLSSKTQEIFIYRNRDNQLELETKKALPFLQGKYTRSMSIIDGRMFFVSGPDQISEVEYKDLSFELRQAYKIPSQWSESGNDIVKIGDYYYLSFSPKLLIRAKKLEAIINGEYENLTETFGFRGFPYYITEFDGRYYIPQVIESSGIRSFSVDREGKINDIKRVYEFGEYTSSSLERLGRFPY